jgi:hypothetical protein
MGEMASAAARQSAKAHPAMVITDLFTGLL